MVFETSPNKHMYAHLTTLEEVEAEMEKLNKEVDEASEMKGKEGLAKSVILKFQIEQLGWRYGEITGIDFMNA